MTKSKVATALSVWAKDITAGEAAFLFGVSRRTWMRWIIGVGEPSISQVFKADALRPGLMRYLEQAVTRK